MAAEAELWGVERIAKHLGIEPQSVRKALWRKGIRERRGYSSAEVAAAWPDRVREDA